MSTLRQDSNGNTRARPRVNTTSFPPFARRRTRVDNKVVQQIPPSSSQHPMSLEALIDALTPPAVPSLAHARNLASLLASHSPLYRRASLSPILASLCSADSPVAFQAAGYDILSAYCENDEAVVIDTAELLSYFSLFLNSSVPWGVDLWEPRFKALRALTKYGNDVVGIELEVLRVLKLWISGAFEGLLKTDISLERAEKAERERSTAVLAKFLTTVLSNVQTAARVSEDDIAGVLDFFAGLVDRSVLLINKPQAQDRVLASSPMAEGQSNLGTPPKSPSHSHRRNHSSVSSNFIPSPASTPSIVSSNCSADTAISLYLDYLSSQLKTLPQSHLANILPLLFRALAFCSSPLPRLSVSRHPAKKLSSEEKITETLSAFFSGPYTATCMLVLKRHLHPSCYFVEDGEMLTSIPISGDYIKRFQTTSTALYTAIGAHRTFRNYIRRALVTRLARAYISRMTSVNYSPSGAPGHMNLESELMEQAWAKEDYASSGLGNIGWDAAHLGKALTHSIEAWVHWQIDGTPEEEKEVENFRALKEDILEEAAGVLKDIWQELDTRSEEEQAEFDEEEAVVVGQTLEKLVEYVIPLRNSDGTPFILPVSQWSTLPNVFLRSLSVLLSRSHATMSKPPLTAILVYMSGNLTDGDTATLPHIMAKQHDLSPTSPEWLVTWRNLLLNPSLINSRRPLTRSAVMETLLNTFDSVRDMKVYRRSLAGLVLEYCARSLEEREGGSKADIAWKILGDEIVLRAVESTGQPDDTISGFVDLFEAVVRDEEHEADDNDAASFVTIDTHSPSPQVATPSTISSIPSPNISRTQSEHPLPTKEKEKDIGIMSIITSFATGHSSRPQPIPPPQPQYLEDLQDGLAPSHLPATPTVSHAVTGVSALIFIFSQLVFTPSALEPKNVALAVRVYHILLGVVKEGKAVRARLAALQFLMRLRADRDHRLYFTQETSAYVTELAGIINRTSFSFHPPISRHHVAMERDGRQLSRGQGTRRLSRTPTTSRSRSRATTTLPQPTSAKIFMPLWCASENLRFALPDTALSEGLFSYNPDGQSQRTVLPVSLYLNALIGILAKETSWDVLSYVLVHLPVQLANKHLFCGPQAREAVSRMLSTTCAGIHSSEMATQLEDQSIKARDAQGLAFHTLSVLISYRRCFDLKQCHLLVEVFQLGLSFGQFSTIKCCLHALSLSAVELQPSVTKYFPQILEMLAKIMSGANIAVHILSFLFLTGSISSLYANFTENDFKMVFGVALQYLQHYNSLDSDPTQSWALSQHVRILSYTVVYIWFLALKLPDRAQHVPYITRRLLLANKGEHEIDDPTEVCFDWLARYTYASADPRPAPSVFSDVLMNTSEEATQSTLNEKTWLLGNSVVTIRALVKRGWFEVLCRRPSGFTKFLCRTENAPLVGAGDVNPDLFSVPITMIMERDGLDVLSPSQDTIPVRPDSLRNEQDEVDVFYEAGDVEPNTSQPDPITGYVWSGTAPSQRRKNVTVNPSFFLLQLSAYPERAPAQTITDPAAVARFVAVLDRIPVIDTHKVGVMYVAPGQTDESDILRNGHGSPAYTRFLEGLGRLINLRGQRDVYAGGLDPDEDGEYAYAWWDDIGQVLYHTATMMPTSEDDPQCNNKKRHIGNDYVRIVWNDSGQPYRFDTLATQFQFVNIVIEPHSLGAIAAFSNNIHENEYFRVTVQRASDMAEFAPVDDFKLVSAESLPLYVRQLSQLADWFASVFADTQRDTVRVEKKTNWRTRMESIRRFKNHLSSVSGPVEAGSVDAGQGVIMGLQSIRDFTTTF